MPQFRAGRTWRDRFMTCYNVLIQLGGVRTAGCMAASAALRCDVRQPSGEAPSAAVAIRGQMPMSARASRRSRPLFPEGGVTASYGFVDLSDVHIPRS